MLHIKLRDRWAGDASDPMSRRWVGYDPNRSAEELFEQNRGVWSLGPRADREKYAAFSYTGDHTVKFIAQIDGFESSDKKRVIVGRVLDPEHPMSQRWVGAPAPDTWRNPITYVDEPDAALLTCACGCGEAVLASRSFVAGHDQKAIHARITRQWGGTLGFIQWFDTNFPE